MHVKENSSQRYRMICALQYQLDNKMEERMSFCDPIAQHKLVLITTCKNYVIIQSHIIFKTSTL